MAHMKESNARIGFYSEVLKLYKKVERMSFIWLVGKQPGMVIFRWKDSKCHIQFLLPQSWVVRKFIGEIFRMYYVLYVLLVFWNIRKIWMLWIEATNAELLGRY